MGKNREEKVRETGSKGREEGRGREGEGEGKKRKEEKKVGKGREGRR